MTNLGDYAYYILIYKYLQGQITLFQDNFLANMMAWASGIALILVTLWILIQGYRMISGQSRDSMMALVLNMARIVIIVTAATTMSIFGTSLQQFFAADGGLGAEISQKVSSGFNSPLECGSSVVRAIDCNMAATQLSLAAIDVVQVPPGDTSTADQKARAMLLAGLGAAGPAMAAGAMLLMYQFTIAIFIGLGPLFILCLIFDQTKSLFQRWLLYGIGTLFSIAVLYLVTTIVLKLTINVAAALWSADIVNHILSSDAEGFSSQALQQGGIGLLLTVLVISVPPMAAAFFQGTVGNFLTYSGFGAAGARIGPQGQPPGSYGGYGGSSAAPAAASAKAHSGFHSAPSSTSEGTANAGSRGTLNQSTPTLDAVKPHTGKT